MIGFVYVNVPTDFIPRRWNLATAYVALAFMALTLLLGPWNVLRGRPSPVSTDLRRDVGIWAGILGLVHSVIGLRIHEQGQFWRYFVYPASERHLLPIRSDAFGLANYTGLGSTLVLLLLLSLSNDAALRRLGPVRWKSLQRFNYAAFGLMAVHSIVYQLLEKRVVPVVAVFVAVTSVVVVTQLAGYRRRRAAS